MNDGLNIDQISFTSATMKQLYHLDRNKITFLFIYNSIEWFVLKLYTVLAGIMKLHSSNSLHCEWDGLTFKNIEYLKQV